MPSLRGKTDCKNEWVKNGVREFERPLDNKAWCDRGREEKDRICVFSLSSLYVNCYDKNVLFHRRDIRLL